MSITGVTPLGRLQGLPFVRVLRKRNFALLWAAMALSHIGDFVNNVALLVLVYRLTGSGLALGGLVTLQMIPSVVLGPVAGALVDRFDRRLVMIVSDVLRGLCVLGLVVCPTVGAVYFTGLAVSFISLFFGPARRAVMPSLVDPEDLVAANSLVGGTQSVARVLGPALGTALLALYGVGAAFGFNAATFFVSAALIGAMGRRPSMGVRRGEGGGSHSLGRAIGRGLRFLAGEADLLILTVLTVVVMVGVGACNVLLLVLVKDVIKAPDASLGVLMSVEGIGGIAGMVLVGNILAAVEPRRLVVGAVSVIGSGLVGLYLFRDILSVMAIIGLMGVAVVVFNVGAETVFQRRVPDTMRGLAFSVIGAAATASALVAAAAAGGLADLLGPTAILGGLGGFVLAGGLAGFLVLRGAGAANISR